MVDNISGMPGNSYSADGLYRVKAMDRDARGGGSGGGFGRQTGKDKKESEDGAMDGNAGTDAFPSPLPARQPVKIHDDIVLSDAASRALVPVVAPGSIIKTRFPKAPAPESGSPGPDADQSGSRIDITA